MDINVIISFLKKDEIKNLSIIGFIENNPISKVWQLGNSAAVKGNSDKDWIYFSSDNEDEFKEILLLINDKTKYYGGLTPWMIPLLSKNKKPDWVLYSLSYYLPADVTVNSNKFETRKLTPGDADYIIEHSDYKQFLSTEYVNDRINKSWSAGIEINGTLAAWGLTHDDGALGSLHVLDKHRRKHLAEEIVISLIHQCREEGKIPFAQIEEQNIASRKLVKKLGFVKDRETVWMKVK
ncbi:MAG: GNAT family N-acetyltransferase [Ignavibacteriaceae bacterium]